jgi:hypothetical protein
MEEAFCGCAECRENAGKQNSRPCHHVQTKHVRRFVQVEPGIYRDNLTGRFFERPTIDGKRTWRKLVGENLKLSREEYYRRRIAAASGRDPYHKTWKPTEAKLANSKEEARTVGDVIRRYQKDGCPDKHLLSRPESTRASKEQHCHTLLPFWDSIDVTNATDPICDNYRDWRLGRITKGEGLRTIDCELNTLSSAFRYSKRRGVVKLNPLTDRPKYQPSSRVRHCREFMPTDADELHEIARELFKDRRSHVLGWQMLAEAYSGLRGCEVLKWRASAKPGQFGFVTRDGKSMAVWRCKNQHFNNPYVHLHEGMAPMLEAHRKWREKNYPDTEWFFPGRGREINQPVTDKALSHALRRIWRDREHHIKPHGNRAFYVTVRRSWGVPDNQIAYEIGHSSGGSTLESVYGGVPPHWRKGEGPRMSWLPINGKPAWDVLKLD